MIPGINIRRVTGIRKGQSKKYAYHFVKKLVLTHITPKSENMMNALIEDVRMDYDGAICLGKDLMVVEL